MRPLPVSDEVAGRVSAKPRTHGEVWCTRKEYGAALTSVTTKKGEVGHVDHHRRVCCVCIARVVFVDGVLRLLRP